MRGTHEKISSDRHILDIAPGCDACGRLRAAIAAEHAASKGLWRLTIAQEQLNDPDPDVRALGIYDRALAFVPDRIRLAESALTVSLERTRHIRSIATRR